MNCNPLDLTKTFKNYAPNSSYEKKMAPSFRGNWNQTEQPKKSAVMILLFPKNDELHILYTKRTINLNDKHSGQISFPGGRYEDIDGSLQQTAIRETFEEIGITISPDSIIGKLSEIHIPVSNFTVQPYVAFLESEPTTFILQKEEIAEILIIPLSHLQLPENIHTKTIFRHNQNVVVPYYLWNLHEIWGATAIISEELLKIMSYEL